MKTEALLKKYLESQLTDEERFELEKRALGDDFLATAWEGLQVHQSADKIENWNALMAKWNARQEEKKETRVISFRKWMPMAVAASVILLAGAFFWLNPVGSDFDKESSVAMQVESVEDLSRDYEDVAEEERIQNAVEKVREIANVESAVPAEKAPERKKENTPQKSSEIASPDKSTEDHQEEQFGFATTITPEDNAATTASIAIIDVQEFVDETEADFVIAEVIPAPSTTRPAALLNDNPIALQPESTSIVIEKSESAESSAVNTINQKLESTARQKSTTPLQEDALSVKSVPNASLSRLAKSKPIANGTPDIGWDAFQEIVEKNGYKKDEAFIRGIKPPINVSVRFKLDDNRHPKEIEVIRGPVELKIIQNILSESGSWSSPNTDEPIEIEFIIPLVDSK